MRVQMVCQFGMPVRGLSPYADALREHLSNIPSLEFEAVDFSSAYPSLLHPAESGGVRGQGELHWACPWTWARVARRPADILHIQHWAPPLATYLWPLAAMARHCGKRVVVTMHNAQSHEVAKSFGFFEDRLLRNADALVVHGQIARQDVARRLGANSPPVTVIAHGVTPLASPGRARADDYLSLGLSHDRRYVLLFGNLRGYKGVDVLLAAWAKVHADLPDVDLVIAGRLWGGTHSTLQRLAARIVGTAGEADRLDGILKRPDMLHNVIIREGFQSDAEIDSLIRISAFTVFPYRRFSGQSGAACRAAAMGRPVLVSRVGALPDLAIDDTWQMTPGDVGELAHKLIEKLSDPAIATVAAVRQLESIRACDWCNVARQHVRLYESLV